MNLFAFMGRLTKEPEIRYTQDQTAVASFPLAVPRWGKADEADFFQCTAFGKTAEFAEKYLKKGTKVVCSGRVQNNNYTNREGVKVYGMQFVAERIEFAESKKAEGQTEGGQTEPQTDDGFIHVPDNLDDTGLPFN